jgi:hypothetical protein
VTPNELGRLAFETYTCWKSGRHRPLIGDAMNSWEDLPANEKQAWTKTAMVITAEEAAEKES